MDLLPLIGVPSSSLALATLYFHYKGSWLVLNRILSPPGIFQRTGGKMTGYALQCVK